MNAFSVYNIHAVRVNHNAGCAIYFLSQALLVFIFDFQKFFQERFVFGIFFNILQFVQVGNPRCSDFIRNKICQIVVGAQHPAARCYAVGHIGKFFWPQFIKFRHQRMFYQFRVQLGYTVYWKRTDNRKICHADNLIIAFAVHNRNFTQFVRIFAKAAAGKFHKAAVDFINNLQMAR